VLTECQFEDEVRRHTPPFYERDAMKGGQPRIDTEVRLKMLMNRFFENLRSDRATATRHRELPLLK
jgi:hypothetical protein